MSSLYGFTLGCAMLIALLLPLAVAKALALVVKAFPDTTPADAAQAIADVVVAVLRRHR